MKRGFLLALEGIDGCGKSTAAVGIVDALRADGHEVVATREPTDGPWGRRIREMARSGETVTPEQELRWFVEDRREHVREVIQPALDAGRVVVTDRYFLSTVAYQGGRGLDWRQILHDAEAEFPLPDRALIFDVNVPVALARIHGRGGEAEPAFEEEAFLTRVKVVYGAIVRPWLSRVDGNRDPDTVLARALERIRPSIAEVTGS